MNLYVISQYKNNDYDTYDSAVVAAVSEDDARLIHPSGREWDHYTWVKKPSDVQVRLIGKAIAGTEAGVICASFNAG